ncbi:MAG TPA: heme-binding beta-barrel domain-containing protein [Myxococcaceae bacterium]|nr:heme-binding beta-barrel domain-containing protein [Myxococcaceae bacterium]
MTPDIFTEPANLDVDTLRNLGPLTLLAGTWEGGGSDSHPVAEGGETQDYLERMVFEPIDPQTNGPQLLYGLRYHIHITRRTERLTFHDQVGYWLWEPATGSILQTIAIPRGQVAMAQGTAARDAKGFSVKAILGSATAGIVSSTFLDKNFRTLEYELRFFVEKDSLRYEQDTLLEVAGRSEPFHHVDRNTLRRVAAPKPNPAAAGPAGR